VTFSGVDCRCCIPQTRRLALKQIVFYQHGTVAGTTNGGWREVMNVAKCNKPSLAPREIIAWSAAGGAVHDYSEKTDWRH
jgi:hypothetical protein